MFRFVLFLWFFLSAAPAWPGAWLREKGSVFSSAAVTIFPSSNYGSVYKSSLYAEWGLRSDLTIGFDAEQHQNLRGHAFVFARLPIAKPGRRGRFAVDIAAGVHHVQTRTWALYKGSLSYGYGFQSGWGNGWIAVDAALEYRSNVALLRKLDLTVGLSAERLLNPLLQIETTYTSDRPFRWVVRPSVMIRPKGHKTAWIVGIEQNSSLDGVGGRFGFWSEF